MSKKKSLLSYYDLSQAFEDVKLGLGPKDTAIAGLKLVGKSGFNAALFAGEIGVEVIKNLPNHSKEAAEKALKTKDLSPEQRERLERHIEKANDLIERRASRKDPMR